MVNNFKCFEYKIVDIQTDKGINSILSNQIGSHQSDQNLSN